jgi:hypothetical protein
MVASPEMFHARMSAAAALPSEQSRYTIRCMLCMLLLRTHLQLPHNQQLVLQQVATMTPTTSPAAPAIPAAPAPAAGAHRQGGGEPGPLDGGGAAAVHPEGLPPVVLPDPPVLRCAAAA